MSNPYQAPAGAAKARTGGSFVLTVLLVAIGMVCAILAALIPTLVLPSFQPVFTSFGADLPFLTRVVMDYYLVLWLCPVVVAAVALAWRPSKRRGGLACAVGVGALALVMPLTILSAYLPIMRLGAVV